MRIRTLLACGLVAATVAAAGACRPKTVPPAPRPDLFVLVPDPETEQVGGATVTSQGGSVELTKANFGTRVVEGRAPTAPAEIPAAEIRQRFGDAMAARPLPPRTFLLYFETGTETLTGESQATVSEVVKFVWARPAPDVTVIGHTDTTSDPKSNFDLGMRRALLIRDLLVKAGLDASQVDVASHGEANLLVPTPDETAEPKNRRVEVTVR